MSASDYVTLSSSVPIYNNLLDHFEKLLDKENREYCKSEQIRSAIAKGYEKLKAYYARTDESEAYAIATSMYFFLLLVIIRLIFLIHDFPILLIFST